MEIDLRLLFCHIKSVLEYRRKFSVENCEAGIFKTIKEFFTISPKLPTDVRKFQIKHLFLMMLSFSLGFAVYSAFPGLGSGFVLATTAFWAGFGFLIVSDTIDHGPIDDRGIVAQAFNIVGILMVAVSVITIVALAVLFILFVTMTMMGITLD
ncbi:MAG: hypothetical protein AB8B55_21895 [Mariniblastus sp.]